MSFLTAQLGVIISLPDPLVVIIGRVRIALPAPDLPIIDLRATVYGEITPDHLLILVSLNGSRIAGFSVGGDIGLLMRWAGEAEFAVSAGGFHPQYRPPPELADMKRLSMDLSPPAILTMRSESYFALTTNSVQFGTHTELGADLGVASISGHFTFDALVVFSPHFAFVIDLDIGLTVRVFGETLCGIHISLHLEGPAPWRAQGTAEVEVLWWTVPIDVGPLTWGDADNPPPAPADPRALVHAALHRNPGAWQALMPPDADQVVRLLPATPSDTDVTVHPMGLFDVRQHAVPLETVITRVGANPCRRASSACTSACRWSTPRPPERSARSPTSSPPATSSTSPTTRKLSRPSFEPMPAGARIRPPGEAADWAARVRPSCATRPSSATTTRCEAAGRWPSRAEFFADSAATTLAAGAAGRSELRAGARYAHEPDPIVLARTGRGGEALQGDLGRRRRRGHPDVHPRRRAGARRRATSSCAWAVRPDGGHAAFLGGRELPRLRRDQRRAGSAHAGTDGAGPLRLPAARPHRASPPRCDTPFALGAAGPSDGGDEGAGRRRPRRPVDAEMTVHVHGPADVTRDRRPPGDPRLPKAGRGGGRARRPRARRVRSARSTLAVHAVPDRIRRAARAVDHARRDRAPARRSGASDAGARPRRARIRRDQLQPLGDAWAWAHAQVMGAKRPDAQDRAHPRAAARARATPPTT